MLIIFLLSQLEEALKLKELLERQLEEALDTLTKEREHKMGLKRELAQYVNIYDTTFGVKIFNLLCCQLFFLEEYITDYELYIVH